MAMLDGIRVLSLNHFLLGPLAAQILGDLGADVVTVEPVGGSFSRNWAGGDIWVDKTSVFYLCAHRNKRSIVANLKTDEGVKIVRRLIEKSDVLMENFRPGVLDRMRLGYDEAKAINPRLIYASGSGWGGSGPYAKKPGQDLLMQAFSGLAHTTGSERPTPAGASIVDHHGAMILAAAILAALVARSRDGKGHRVEVDLMSAALDLQVEPLVAWFNGGAGRSTRPPGNVAGWAYAAPYGIYQAADGFIALSLGPLDKMAKVFGDDRLASLTEQDCWARPREISELFAQNTSARSVSEILAAFEDEGLWAARVNDFEAVANDPQIVHLGIFEDVLLADGNRVRLVRHPAIYDGERPGTRLPPPALGADTDSILQELGYDSHEVQALRANGSIA
jgi:crotonobetainyl-CoA:carnitine CoA-transferase CaiB-like acyl-CoA transferase